MKKVRLTATRVSVSHYNRFKLRLAVAVIAPRGNIVKFAYDAGLLEARRTASAGISAAISLYSKNGCDISLSERNGRDDSLFAKRMRRLFIYSIRNGYEISAR